MSPLAVCVFAAAAAAVLVTLRRIKPEFAELAAAAAGIVTFLYIADGLAPLIQDIKGYAESSGAESYFAVMLKALAISLCCRMSADICRDCGENSLASRVELAGKAGIVILSLPVIKQLLETVKELM